MHTQYRGREEQDGESRRRQANEHVIQKLFDRRVAASRSSSRRAEISRKSCMVGERLRKGDIITVA